MKFRSHLRSLLPAASIALAALAPACGHVKEPKPYSPAVIENQAMTVPPAEQQFIRGRENVVVDGLGHYFFSLPYKLVLWNWKVDNHHISAENEARMKEYFDVNSLGSTQMRINSYAPGDEWRRLKANKDKNGTMKYTFGAFSVLRYTIIPERLFAGLPYIGRSDHYDSYTNTVHIYSDHPAIQIQKAARARLALERREKGKFSAALTSIHPFSVKKEYVAMKDTASFFHCRGEDKLELDTYPILWPSMGKQTGSFIPYYVGYGLAGVGHAYGRYYRHERKEQLAHGNQFARGYCGAPGASVSRTTPDSVTQ